MIVWVTDLDKYRWFKANEEKTTEEYLASFVRREPTEAMLKGINLENWLMEKISEIPPSANSWTLDQNHILTSRHLNIVMPRVQAVQIPVRKTYSIGNDEVTIVGKIDAQRGNTLYDWKTTGSTINLERYIDDFQWRLYLDMTNLEDFVYQVFQLSKRNSYVVDYKNIRLEAYPRMRQDIIDELSEYVAFLYHLKDLGLVELPCNRRVKPIPNPEHAIKSMFNDGTGEPEKP